MYACKHREIDLCYTEIFKSQLQYAASLLHQNELIILLNKKFPGRDHIPLMCIWPFHKIKTGKLHFAAHLTQHMKVSVAQSCLTLCDPMDWQPTRLLCPWNSPGKITRVGSCSLLQGTFLTQGSNLDLLHFRQIPYHLSHQGYCPAKAVLKPECGVISVLVLSCVQLFATPWTVAHQAPLSMGFSRQEYWSELP